jgi:hypothetical protein
MVSTKYTNPWIVYVVGELCPIELEWGPGQRFGFPLQSDHSVGQLKKLVIRSQSSCPLEEGTVDEDCVEMPPYSENARYIHFPSLIFLTTITNWMGNYNITIHLRSLCIFY